MAAGLKRNYDREGDSGAWEDEFAIAKADADNLEHFSLMVGADKDGNPVSKVVCDYVGSGAITLANYKGLPIRSVIWDHQANKYHVKKAASGTSTWVSSAAAS